MNYTDFSDTYKDVIIKYDEDKEEWIVDNNLSGLQTFSFKSLKAAKAAIDKSLKRKFIPVSVWFLRGSLFSEITQITATRPHKKQSDGMQFWVKDKYGDRFTSWGDQLFLNTPENRKIFPIIVSKQEQISLLQKEVDEMIENIEILKEMKEVD